MITSFQGEHRWLSNFGDSPLVYGGRKYLNSESAYQAQKFIEEWIRAQFGATSGKEAKKLAREYDKFKRKEWLQMNLGIMVEVVHAKFTQNKDIRDKLMLTYPQELVEGNTWNDLFWGVCNGAGQNWLGRVLMAERSFWLDLSNKDTYKNDRLVPAFDVQTKGEAALRKFALTVREEPLRDEDMERKER